jgi:hypothetical protein
MLSRDYKVPSSNRVTSYQSPSTKKERRASERLVRGGRKKGNVISVLAPYICASDKGDVAIRYGNNSRPEGFVIFFHSLVPTIKKTRKRVGRVSRTKVMVATMTKTSTTAVLVKDYTRGSPGPPTKPDLERNVEARVRTPLNERQLK